MNAIHLVFVVLNLTILAAALPTTRDAVEAANRIRVFGAPDTAGIIRDDGYTVETYTVVTATGYVLEIFRIPNGRGHQASESRPPVFLMHGMMTLAQAYVSLGPQNSLAYNLADAGFDVWLGNARGTRHSRKNIHLDPDSNKQEFFDFTWEQIGAEDVPTMVDFVLEKTGRKQLHYIGHSQGGTAFLVLNSLRPEYNEKFVSADLLAGVGYMGHFPDERVGNLAQQTDAVYALAVRLGFVELFPPNSTISSITGTIADMCTGDVNFPELCDLIGVGSFFEDLKFQFGGCSIKQLAHFGQNIRDGTFRRWNYGLIGNWQHYRRLNPPDFDLSRITVKTTMHYSLNDNLLSESDALAMAQVMPNTVARKVARDSFEHNDYLAAEDAKELVSEYIIQQLSDYN